MWARNQSASQAVCQSVSLLVCLLERLVQSGTSRILIRGVRTRLIEQTRETRVHRSRDVDQEKNKTENPIVFSPAFSLFTRAPNAGLTKSLYLSQNFVFYNFPDFQVNSLEPSIHADYPPPPKVVQLLVY